MIGVLWAFPTTVIGWVNAKLNGAGRAKMLEYEPLGVAVYIASYSNWWFRLFPALAITIGQIVLVNPRYATSFSEEVLRHEHRHFVQACWLGPLFLPAYGLASLWALVTGKHYYRDNWFEIDARAYERRT